MRFAVFVAVALAVAVAAKRTPHHKKNAALPPLPNFTGYVVTAQWDGRTVPTVQWALDVTRQDVEFRPKQELKLQKLIPTTPGNALSPTYTAYDPISRQYFTTVVRNNNTASLWGQTIAVDVESSTPMTPFEVRYQFELNNLLVGLEAWNNAGTVVVLAIFQDGTVSQIDPATGASTLFGKLFSDPTQFKTTTAITLNTANNLLYAIVQPAEGKTARSIVTLGLSTGAVASTLIQPLQYFNAPEETPFEMNYIPNMHVLLVFFSGPFDQILYIDPGSGMTAFAVENLMDYLLEFYFDDFLEDDDTWANSAYDPRKNFLYFQCSETSSSDDMTTTSLCRLDLSNQTKNWLIPQVCISPMTYGYAGMQFVEVA